MKKLIAIALVLAMAPIVSAGLYTAPETTIDNITWNVVDDQLVGFADTAGAFDYLFVTAEGALSNGFADAGAGNLASFATTMGPAGSDAWGVSALSTDGVQTAGKIWFTADINAATAVDVYTMEGGAPSLVTSFAISEVPEPITMALMGLGGLFLRRRRA